MKLIFGTTSYLPFQPRMLLGNINFFSIPYVIYDLAIIGIILGFFIEKFFLRKIYFRDEIVVVLVTYGLFLIFEDAMKLIFGTTSYLPYQPRMLSLIHI